jgi:hypothetical protein
MYPDILREHPAAWVERIAQMCVNVWRGPDYLKSSCSLYQPPGGPRANVALGLLTSVAVSASDVIAM